MIKNMNTVISAAGFLLSFAVSSLMAADGDSAAAKPAAAASTSTAPKAIEYKITEEIPSVTVMHNGQPVVIVRNQNPENTINPAYAKTTRKCPPFCVNPISIAPGVETIGEVEMLDYLKRASAGEPIVVIDSRTEDWVAKGTIPGSVNVPWTHMGVANDPANMATVLEFHFGVERTDKFWDFRNAKTLVLFCNGMWCGQSPTNIRNLLAIGYPAHKIKWYRGGMQDWEALGLTTVKP
jgi:rhodanese-related sulfurtransferase